MWLPSVPGSYVENPQKKCGGQWLVSPKVAKRTGVLVSNGVNGEDDAVEAAAWLSFESQNCETRTSSTCVRNTTFDNCYATAGKIAGDKYPNPGQLEKYWSCPVKAASNCCIGVRVNGVFNCLQGSEVNCPTPNRLGDAYNLGTTCASQGLPNKCLSRASGFGCYCDIDCVVWGDCCSNWRSVCSVPVVKFISPTSGVSEGGNNITIYGLNFRSQGANSKVQVGGVTCPIVSWVESTDPLAIYLPEGNSMVVCTVGAGEGSQTVKVTDSNNIASDSVPELNSNVQYVRLSPSVTLMIPTQPATNQATAVTLIGTSFGTGPKLNVTQEGGYNARITPLVSFNHTTIVFNLPAGQGNKNYRFLVESSSGIGVFNWQFAAPEITGVSPNATGNTQGGYKITLTGRNFGPGFFLDGTSQALTARVGKTAATVDAGSTHSSATITVPPGEGSNTLFVNAGGLSSPGNGPTFEYNNPVVSSVQPASGPTQGGWLVTVSGSNFGGLPLANTSAVVYFGRGGLSCLSSTFQAYNSTYIVCPMPPGQGQGLIVYVNVANKESVQTTQRVSFDNPVISDINPKVCPTDSSVSLTLTGSNFGVDQQTVRQGNTPLVLSLKNHTMAVFTPLQGTGLNQPVTITVIAAVSNTVTFSYMPPTISSVTLPTGGLPSGGGGLLTLNGDNFGPSTTVVNMSFLIRGQSVSCANCISSVSHKNIVLQAPPGAGIGNSISVGVGGQTASSTHLNYSAPKITSVGPAAGSALPTGGLLLQIAGSDLSGLTFFPPVIALSSGACVLESSSNPSAVTCRTPAGRGVVTGTLTLGGQAVNFQFTHDGPLISSLAPNTADTAFQSAEITIFGSSFDTSGSVRIGAWACTVTSWNHSRITCLTPEGEGTGLNVTITTTVLGLSSRLPAAFSYKGPTITSVSRSSGPTLGGEPLTIEGVNFGLSPQAFFSSVVPIYIAPTATPTHTRYITTVPLGQGQRFITITVGGQSSSAFAFSYRYNRPVVTSLNPSSGESAGNYNVTITGENFGVNGEVYFGSDQVTVLSRNAAQTQIVVRAINGTGTRSVTVTTEFQTSLAGENSFTYLGPRLDSLSPTIGPTLGGTLLTLTGISFSSYVAGKSFVTIGGQDCSYLPAQHKWNDTYIECILPENKNLWLALPVLVTVQNIVSSSRSAAITFSYTKPEVDSVSPQLSTTRGGITVTVSGSNFGTGQALLLRVGDSTCTSPVTNAMRTQITCQLPAGQDSQLVRVQGSELQVRSSNTVYYTYGGPRIDSLSTTRLDTNGGSLTVYGRNFFTSGILYIGGEVCIQSGGFDHETITCSVQAGTGANLNLVVVTGNNSTQLAGAFSFNPPRLTSLLPSTGPTDGGVTLTIAGGSLGTANATVTVGGAACPVVAQVHTQIKCTQPPGRNVNQAVNVVVGGQSSATQLLFNYTGPSITSTTSNVPTAGNVFVTVIGRSFDTSGEVRIGPPGEVGKVCSPVTWSHSQIVCTAPEGQGTANNLVVTVQPLGLTSAPYLFDYQPPTLANVTSSRGFPTKGGNNITLTGSNFGLTPVVTLTYKASTDVTAVVAHLNRSHTQLVVPLPAGQGAITASVSVLGRGSDPALIFAYDGPVLVDINPTSGQSAGGTNLTLTGSNFGFTPKVFIGISVCEVLFVNAEHTTIICSTPAGASTTQVKVVVGAKESSTLPFRFESPELVRLDPANGPTKGGIPITITGLGLATGDISFSGTPCPFTGTRNSTRVVCMLPEGDGVSSVTITSSSSSNALDFTYDPPVITLVSPNIAPTEGGTVASISGQNFGDGSKVQVRIGGKSTVITFANHTLVVINTPTLSVDTPSLQLVLSLGSRQATTGFTLKPPSIANGGIFPITAPAVGGTIMTLTGSSFSTKGKIYFGGQLCSTGSFPHTHTLLRCTLPAGAGQVNVTVETFDGLLVSRPEFFAYNIPVVTNTEYSQAPTIGGTLVTLTGSNFGPSVGNVYIGGQACISSPSQWTDARLVCQNAPGQGKLLLVEVVAKGQSCTLCGEFSFDPPSLTSLVPTSGPTTGQNTLVILGSNLGLNPSVLDIQIIHPSTNEKRACVPISARHLNASCIMPVFTGKAAEVKVVVAGSDRANPLYYSYEAPVLTQVTGCSKVSSSNALATANCDVVGTDTITIIGQNFGDVTLSAGSVKVKGLDCENIVLTVSHTKIVCKVPANPLGGFDVNVSVTVDGQMTASPLLSYAGPEILVNTLRNIDAASPSVGDIVIGDPMSTERIEFQGSNLGLNSNVVNVWYGLPASPKDYFPCINLQLTSVSADVQKIRCNLVSGVGQGLVFQVKVGQQLSQPGKDTLSYLVPQILASTLRVPGDDGDNKVFGISSQGQILAFDVLRLGAYPDHLGVYYGLKATNGPFNQNCTVLPATNKSSFGVPGTVVCRTGPSAVVGPWLFKVRTLNLYSAAGTDEYSYPQPPVIVKVSGCSEDRDNATFGCPTKGGVLITIDGDYFATTGTGVTIDSVVCPIQSVSSIQVVCMLDQGRGPDRAVVVSVGERVSNNVYSLSFAPPYLTGIEGCTTNANQRSVSNCIREGGDSITIRGHNFGNTDAVVMVGGSLCVDTAHVPNQEHNTITCKVPLGSGLDRTVLVLQRQSSNTTLGLSYLPCPAGQYSVGNNCSNCSRGSYSEEAGRPLCTQCEPGRYQPEQGQTGCSVCETGRAVDRVAGIGASSCSSCERGFFSDVRGLVSCLPCPAGTFQNETGKIACVACTAGYASNRLNAIACIPCNPGDFANTQASLECRQCGTGRYSDRSAAQDCTDCEAGSAQSLPRQTSCPLCQKGFYAKRDAQFTCEPCAPGFFANDTGLTECFPCKPGLYAFTGDIEAGATTCLECDKGTYMDLPAQPVCLDCPQGRAVATRRATVCPACVAGRSAQFQKKETCDACNPGYFASSTASASCEPCAAGTFANVSSQSVCQPCPSGRISATAATSCVDCPAGSVASQEGLLICSGCVEGTISDRDGQRDCEVCPAGSYSKAGANSGPIECKPCAVGTASSGQRTAGICPSCPAGRFQNTTGKTDCLPCLPGFASSGTGRTSCIQCEPGYYASLPEQLLCEPCKAGYYAAERQAKKCTACMKGFFQKNQNQQSCDPCEPGYFSENEFASSCKPCPQGKISTEYNSTSCTDCEAGKVQVLEGKYFCIDCGPGRYINSPGQLACLDCIPGRYSDQFSNSQCSPCDTGRYSGSSRASNCPVCLKGYYAPEEGLLACVPADLGQYVGQDQATTFLPCKRGFYQDAPAQSVCKPCEQGKFSGQSGAIICDPCQPGRAVNAVNASECPLCPAGTFSGAQAKTCTNCSAGYYTLAEGAVFCMECLPGTYQNLTGQSSCMDCEPGRSQRDQHQNTCNQCEKGRANSGLGKAECVECAAGWYANSTGSTACTQCAKGFYVSIPQAESCIACARGFFQNALGQITCKPCAVGSSVNQTAQSSCELCQPGSAAAEGEALCAACALGKAAVSAGQGLCSECPLGRYGLSTTECRLCAPGKAQTRTGKTVCDDCAPGFFSGVAGLQACLACPQGSISAAQATSCTQCAAGYVQPEVGKDFCSPCEPGKAKIDTGAGLCIECEPGKISASAQPSCTKCPAGFIPDNLHRSCLPCGPGFFSPVGGAFECTKCPAGFYSNVTNATQCTGCELGRYQSQPQQTQCQPCPVKTFTDVIGTVTCGQCPAGKYGNVTGQTACHLCEVGRYSKGTGGIGVNSCTLCEAGRFASARGRSDCTRCPAGTSQSGTGAQSCVPCPSGRSQGESGQLSCDLCGKGRFADTQGNIVCKSCVAGLYGNESGLVSCIACEPGKTSDTRAEVCIDCVVGRYQPARGQPQCLECDLGQFQNLTGKEFCDICGPGTYQDELGGQSCKVCQAGYFSSASGFSKCDACPPGQIGNETGASSCVDCEIGKFRGGLQPPDGTCQDCPAGRKGPIVGQSECTPCAAGFYQNQTSSSDCIPCEIGYYQNDTDRSSCLACMPGFVGGVRGLTGCVPCMAGTINTQLAASACSTCDIGYFQRYEGNTSCEPCPPGTFARGRGEITCMLCSPGYYSPSLSSQVCLTCEAGTFAENVGATICEDCAAGYTTKGAGTVICDLCPFGRASNKTKAASCDACAPGYHAENLGQRFCDLCPQGRFGDQPGQATCFLCKEGFYQDELGQGSCKICQPPNYNDQRGSVSCKPCGKGYYTTSTGTVLCNPCASGYYVNETGASGCLPCDPGYNSSMGASACSPCPKGQYSEAGGVAVCTDCPTGRYNDQVSLTVRCFPCPPGRINDHEGQSTCQECSPGRFNFGGGLGACDQCQPGYFSNATGLQKCYECAPGYYQDLLGKELCLSCKRGTATNQAKSAQCKNCAPGFATNLTGQHTCLPCAIGFFAGNESQFFCNLCPAGTTSTTDGQSACTPCQPGEFSNGTGFCQPCERGSFASAPGQDKCTPCRPGEEQPRVGEKSCDPCPAGSVTTNYGATACDVCEIGYFSNSSTQCELCPIGRAADGAGFCKLCEKGFFSNGTQLEKCYPCEAGLAQPQEGQTSCAFCREGYYAPAEGSVNCQMCPQGTYTLADATEKVLECLGCPKGYQKPAPGPGPCRKCPKGKFNPSQSQALCGACVPGRYTDVLGETVCQLCKPGFFSEGEEGSSACTPCAPGFATVRGAASSCDRCEPGYAQARSGQGTCDACSPGYSASGFGTIECTVCTPGRYAEGDNNVDCSECKPHTATNESATAVCPFCPPGQEATASGATECTVCPKGKSSRGDGTKCTPCAGRTVAPYQGMPDCNVCPGILSSSSDDLTECLCATGYYAQPNTFRRCTQ
eukprot:g61239.t1